jgi:hypothetical protein
MIRKFDAVKVKIAFSFQHTLDVCAETESRGNEDDEDGSEKSIQVQ